MAVPPPDAGRVTCSPVRSAVRAVTAASPEEAAAHFADRLRFETDCADVHADLVAGVPGIVVVDARMPAAYAAGHVPGARSLPHTEITPARVRALLAVAARSAAPAGGTVFVTYCWGPHCNGATRAARALAALGYPVKEMIGGIAGWRAEGYDLATASVSSDCICRTNMQDLPGFA
jgi:rhodanese-related sulfurtransferase